MRAVPGTLQTGGAPFASTRWSVVAACDSGGTPTSGETEAAVAQLCRDYWPPLYSFVRRRGFPPADAQDLVQGFFETWRWPWGRLSIARRHAQTPGRWHRW